MAIKPPVPVRQIVAANVQALLDRDFPGRRGQITRFQKKHSGIPLSKMQRAVADGGVNLETIAQLAVAFDVAPYQLLIDRLNVKEPQIAIERRYVATARQMAQDLAGMSE